MISIQTQHPIAYDSPDHIQPWGTARDNCINLRFNYKLKRVFRKLNVKKPHVLDLGCSGGGFINSCLQKKWVAVGLEGSDYSLKRKRACWKELAGSHLFTCDVTKPFSLRRDDRDLQFDLITMWEVLEHLKEDALPQTFKNLKNHLSRDGLLIVSVSPLEEVIEGTVLHQTVKPEDWWVELFRKHGFSRLRDYENYFNQQYIRGPNQGAPNSSNLIFKRSETEIPTPPQFGIFERRRDRKNYFVPGWPKN